MTERATHTTPKGAVVPIFAGKLHDWSNVNGDDPKGLGTIEVIVHETFVQWVYLYPRHPPTAIHVPNGLDPNEPPPLPKPESMWAKCNCSKAVGGSEHICGGCGQPYFIEIHGWADGYCTYCYHRG